jgi:hypothetical protein
MRILAVIIITGFLTIAAMVFFFNPTEPSYPEDVREPPPILAR